MRFAPKTWVLWHDNFGTAMQKVGWVVRGIAPGDEVKLRPEEMANFDLKFMPPHLNVSTEETYFCALPNPNGMPYLFKPANNKLLPMPASKQQVGTLASIKMEGGQRIHIRSNGRAKDTLVVIGDTPIGGLTRINIEMTAQGDFAKVTLEGTMPDLSLAGRTFEVREEPVVG